VNVIVRASTGGDDRMAGAKRSTRTVDRGFDRFGDEALMTRDRPQSPDATGQDRTSTGNGYGRNRRGDRSMWIGANDRRFDRPSSPATPAQETPMKARVTCAILTCALMAAPAFAQSSTSDDSSGGSNTSSTKPAHHGHHHHHHKGSQQGGDATGSGGGTSPNSGDTSGAPASGDAGGSGAPQ
jgi:hypothetical protein